MGNICSAASHQNQEAANQSNKAKVLLKSGSVSALLGDIGGTHLRLALHRLDIQSRSSTKVKELTIYQTNDFECFEDAIRLFLKVRTRILFKPFIGLQTRPRRLSKDCLYRNSWYCKRQHSSCGTLDYLKTCPRKLT